jgi:hypothetical protein
VEIQVNGSPTERRNGHRIGEKKMHLTVEHSILISEYAGMLPEEAAQTKFHDTNESCRNAKLFAAPK